MKLTFRREADVFTILLTGELDHHAAKDIMREIGELVDIHLPQRCVLDMSGVSFMDSSGIAVIMLASRRIKELGGTLTVVNLPSQARRVLVTAGLDRLVPLI